MNRRNLQQAKSKVTVDLSLQLDLDIEVELQSQTQLLALAITTLFLTASASQPSKSLSSGVANLADGLACGVLDHVASTANKLASRDVLGDVVEGTSSLSALLLALAVAAASRLGDVGSCISVLGISASSSTASRLATPRLRF